MATNLSEGQNDLQKFGRNSVRRRRRQANARSRHRLQYWRTHDRDSYICPDCDRPEGETQGFEVHHIDRNPFNGDPENLVGLCRGCHLARHGFERGSTLEEWKDGFRSLGGEFSQ